jgi:hypothetical protein
MNQELKGKLEKILADHKLWLEGKGGEKADLSNANLSNANLSEANLSEADLSKANLSEAYLYMANLSKADLSEANLSKANLSKANLSKADLSEANLYMADLSKANLSKANLDFSCWPLWCGSLNAKVDQRIINQLAYHLAALPDCPKELKKVLAKYANKFHRVTTGECKEIVIERGK